MKLWRSSENSAQQRFNRVLLPHLDSAYNLARWLARNDDDASDIVQEAFVKAFRNMDQLNTANSRAWLMSIVRNTSHTFLAKKSGLTSSFVDEAETLEWHGPTPEQALLVKEEKEILLRLLEELPAEFREVIILRDMEELSYKEIAEVVGVPIGTVMSRINRARHRLQQRLSDSVPEERKLGL